MIGIATYMIKTYQYNDWGWGYVATWNKIRSSVGLRLGQQINCSVSSSSWNRIVDNVEDSVRNDFIIQLETFVQETTWKFINSVDKPN